MIRLTLRALIAIVSYPIYYVGGILIGAFCGYSGDKQTYFAMLFAAVGAILLASPLRGEDLHHHPPQDAQLHEQWYVGWMKPDKPNESCCNKQDCYPALFKLEGGVWFAQRREDGKWILIPPVKFEQKRESPDGRNHVCMPPPNHTQAGTIFCAITGSGI